MLQQLPDRDPGRFGLLANNLDPAYDNAPLSLELHPKL